MTNKKLTLDEFLNCDLSQLEFVEVDCAFWTGKECEDCPFNVRDCGGRIKLPKEIVDDWNLT